MTSTPEPSQHAAIAERVIGPIVDASSPALSPDGAQVAFVVRWISFEENTRCSRVWIAPLDASAPPRPVSGGDHDTAPEWSPDGRELAFVSRRGEKRGEASLHVLPFGGGETRTVATRKEGIDHVRWSPDGRWLGFLSRVPDARYDARDVGWQPPRKIETFFTRLNEEDWTFDRPNHVHVVAADGTTAARDLTPGTHEYADLAWLPDSSGVVTSAARHERWDLDLATDLFVVGLDGEVRELTHQTGNYGRARVSPDGTTVSFLGQDDPMWIGNQHVGLIPVGGGEHRWISRKLDRTFTTTAGTQEPRWLDDETLLATAEDRGETHLYRLHTDGREPVQVTHGPLTVTACDARGGSIVACVSRVDRPADLHVVEPSGRLRPLTDFGSRYAETARPAPWEKFTVPCRDGSGGIDAWIMRPDGRDQTGRHPVILNVHGGPFTQYGETFFDEAQYQAAAGFVVLMCNPRGGSGREDWWSQSIAGPKHPTTPGTAWGSVDADDVLAVLDAALERYPFCDPDRVGMQGGSYGGYLATHLAGTTGTRFRAICSERAVNNFLTEEFTSDVSTSFKTVLGLTHVEDPEGYLAVSPIRYARDIEVPVLIIHSEEDYRCPVNQAEELFVALRLLGKDVTFYRFPGENHELSRSGSPVHRRQRAEIILDFFAQHLTPASGQAVPG